MTFTSVAYLLVYGIVSAIAVTLLKSSGFQPLSMGAFSWSLGATLNLTLGVVLYLASFVIWLQFLGGTSLGIALPLALSITAVLSQASAILFLGEQFNTYSLLGLCLVIAGVALLTAKN